MAAITTPPPDRRTIIVVPRSPLGPFMMTLCVISGLVYLTGARPPQAVEALMPGWERSAWYLLLTLGGAVALVGMAWRPPRRSMIVERAGMLGLACAGLLYSLALAALANPATTFSIVITLGFALSCGWRAVQLTPALYQRWVNRLARRRLRILRRPR